SVIDMRYLDRPTYCETKRVVLDWRLRARRASARSIAIRIEKSARVQRVIREILVRATVQVIGARFRNVLNKSAAGMTILSRVRRRDHLHFLNALLRRRALVALLVTDGVSKRGAIEEVLRSHRLAAVNSGVELAATEHWIAIWLHWQVAGLNLKKRFGKTHI